MKQIADRRKLRVELSRSVISQIRIDYKKVKKSAGFLLGAYRMRKASLCIEILKYVAAEQIDSLGNFSYNDWLKVFKYLSVHPFLAIVGGGYILQEKTAATHALMRHNHAIHFPGNWQVSLSVDENTDKLSFWGKLNGNPSLLLSESKASAGKSKSDGVDIDIYNLTSRDSKTISDAQSIHIDETRDLDKSAKPIEILVKTEALLNCFEHTNQFQPNEAGGVLIGKGVAADNRVYISGYIPAIKTNAGKTHLTFTHDSWNEIHKQLDKLSGVKIVGWYHSHPGMKIFFSSYDQFVHQSFFRDALHVGLVVDPLSNRYHFYGWHQGEICAIKCVRV